MDTSKFTDRAKQALMASQEVMRRHRHSQLDVEHLLLALLESSDALAEAQQSQHQPEDQAAASTDLQGQPQDARHSTISICLLAQRVESDTDPDQAEDE